jgi:hypothetical protein
MPRGMKMILIVRPREGKAPIAWPDQVTMHVRRGRASRKHAWEYAVTGFSTLVEYTPATIIPLDRDAIMALTKEWRDQYGRGRWDFYLKPEGHKPALFDPRDKKIFFISETLGATP